MASPFSENHTQQQQAQRVQDPIFPAITTEIPPVDTPMSDDISSPFTVGMLLQRLRNPSPPVTSPEIEVKPEPMSREASPDFGSIPAYVPQNMALHPLQNPPAPVTNTEIKPEIEIKPEPLSREPTPEPRYPEATTISAHLAQMTGRRLWVTNIGNATVQTLEGCFGWLDVEAITLIKTVYDNRPRGQAWVDMLFPDEAEKAARMVDGAGITVEGKFYKIKVQIAKPPQTVTHS